MPTLRPLVVLAFTMVVAVSTIEAGPQTGTTKPQTPTTKPQTTTTKPKPPSGRGTTPAGRGAAAPSPTPAMKAKLKNPAALKEVAPAEFRASFDTSAGPIVILVHRAWSPKGADRFYNLVKNGFYDDCRFFRVLPGFMAQFGINGDPAVQRPWQEANIKDDPPNQSNKRGTVSFATRGPDTRTTQVFINFRDNGPNLDPLGFTPFGEVVSGMEAVDKINSLYRERPDQIEIQQRGNKYLEQFPNLDYVKKATIVRTPATAPAKK